jgi:hypothetical protein
MPLAEDDTHGAGRYEAKKGKAKCRTNTAVNGPLALAKAPISVLRCALVERLLPNVLGRSHVRLVSRIITVRTHPQPVREDGPRFLARLR